MEPVLVAQLVNQRQKILNFIRKKISDPQLAEDILQDSLLKAIKSAPDLNDKDKLIPWFYRIVVNSITDVYRKRGSNPSGVELSEDILQSLDSSEHEDYQELCSCFIDLLPGLKPEYRELIKRLDLNGEPTTQLAAELEITGNNLKVRHHRARLALRKRLEETCRVCAKHHCLDCTCSQKTA